MRSRQIVWGCRFVRVILAQGPRSSSPYRSKFKRMTPEGAPSGGSVVRFLPTGTAIARRASARRPSLLTV